MSDEIVKYALTGYDAGVAPSRMGTLVSLSDHLAVVAAARAEIERLVADLEWMRTDRNKWQDSATERYNRAEKAEAERDSFQAMFRSCLKGNDALREKAQKANTERDEARAQVAMAYEAASKAAIKEANNWNPNNMAGVCGFQCGYTIVREIRALTPTDAKAALEAYGREKMREGMQRAAEIARNCWNDPQCECDAEYIPNAILAEMETLK